MDSGACGLQSRRQGDERRDQITGASASSACWHPSDDKLSHVCATPELLLGSMHCSPTYTHSHCYLVCHTPQAGLPAMHVPDWYWASSSHDSVKHLAHNTTQVEAAQMGTSLATPSGLQ